MDNKEVVTEKNLFTHIEYIREDVKEIKVRLEKHYITKQEFEPIRKLVYGVVALIGTCIAGAILKILLMGWA